MKVDGWKGKRRLTKKQEGGTQTMLCRWEGVTEEGAEEMEKKGDSGNGKKRAEGRVRKKKEKNIDSE